MAAFPIATLNDLQNLTKKLACSLITPPFPVLFLEGDLGAGKTTFVAALISQMPGGNDCEVGSPSFNFCNLYPTIPPVAHFDLYRSRQHYPLNFLEALENNNILNIVEWSSYLPHNLRPCDWLDIKFILADNVRRLEIAAQGKTAQDLLQSITSTTV